MERYFITGGDGFIGYHIIEKILDSKNDVEIISYDSHKHFLPILKSRWNEYQTYRLKNQTDDRIIRIRGDVTDYARLKNRLKKYKPDYIIHLAALPIANISNEYPAEAKINVLDSVVELLDALRDASFNFKRFIYTSSSMVYGDFLRDENGNVVPAKEDQKCDPIGLYGSMKLSGEHIAKAYGHRFDFPVTIIRPSAVYGPTDANKRVTEIFLTKALNDEKLRLDNGGRHKLDFTYVKDLAEGFFVACENDNAIGETFNMTRGEGRSIRELAQVVSGLIPNTETYDHETNVYRPNRGALDISKAKNLLGFDPKHSLEQGFKKYYEFVKAYSE